MPETPDTHVRGLTESERALLISILREHGVRRAVLFGSYARDEQQVESDLDLLIEPADNATLFSLARLEAALEAALERRVDLITFHALETQASPRLRAHITQDMETLYA